jgi:hypothetical protein
MSMDRCAICQKLVDTDLFPGAYREEFDDDCICDACYETRDEEDTEGDDE